MVNETLLKADKAVRKFLNNLAQSDFVNNAGSLAMKELREYTADMTDDIFEVFEGRRPTAEETSELIKSYD